MNMKTRTKPILTYVIFIAIALAVGGLSAALNAGKFQTPDLARPPLSPPAWLFPIVWTILYTLMGVSGARVWLSGSPAAGDALFLWAAQLLVNFLWTVFYFQFQALLLSFFWLLFLILLVILMVVRFHRIDCPAGRLQIPYLIWLCFAAYLNLATWLLNGSQY